VGGGTMTVDDSTLTVSGDDTLMVIGSTLMVGDCTLVLDLRLIRLPRTIDQKWIVDRVFNRDSEFHTHVNAEKELCV
jgi:hypothetical protein